jgi:hypothetical protein
MILAAPLVIPFAEAVGISIASLGMAKAADMVNEYIQENPEQSVKILSTIVPNVGIGQIFANKEDSDDDEEVSETEEVTESESGSTKDMVLEELNKEKGNYSDPEAKGNYASARGRIIGRLRREGKIRQDNDPNYDPDKKYKDFTKFYKNRRRKADGGAIGIEVLFGPKRQELFMGGPALTGPALNIYNSMKAYESFTDQEIADAIKEAGYSLPTADSGTTTPPSSSTPSVGDNSGNDGRSALPIGSVTGSGSGLIGDYMTATQDRQNRLTNPNEIQSFINKFTGGGQRDIGEMIRSGEVDTRKSSGIPLGVGAAFARMMPDKYYDMSLGDQVFTQSQMGYTGPTVFGENSMGNKDPFGLNVRSGFGNYAEAVGSNFDQLRDTLTKDRAGVTFNEETGLFEGVNADAVNKQTEMIRNKYNFRKQQLGVKNVLDSKIKAADAQREKERLAVLEKARQERIAKQKIAAAEKAERDRVAAAEKAAAIKAKKQRDMQAQIAAAERKAELARRQTIADAQKARGQTTSGGRGNYRSDRDNSRDGGYGGSSQRSRDNRSSDLGFSDIRLKENVELIGKSPSNINIYKFNYKDNPTTYQGAMAHEVPWASVKHSNGYMMIDYDQIDVEFKKI